MTLAELFVAYRNANRRLRAASTQKAYTIAIRKLASAVGHEPTIEDLSDESLIALERSLDGLSEFTINGHTGCIKAMWRWAAQRHIVDTWPTLPRLETPEPERPAWSVDQVQQLLDACDQTTGRISGIDASAFWRAWHYVQWTTGERTGAMLSLRWEWITERGIDVPGRARKAGKRAFYVLPADTRQSLDAIRKPDRSLIFPWPLTLASFYNHYSRLLKRAGLPAGRKCKPQRMRRTHLTYWAIGGGDPTARAQHTSRAITDRFYLDQSLMPQPDPTVILPPLRNTTKGTDDDGRRTA